VAVARVYAVALAAAAISISCMIRRRFIVY
jgi:hypothetical protein